jgi:hypothetical protein
LREAIPRFVKTLRRCHSTVRGLRNSFAPISGFEWPSRRKLGDLRFPGCEIVVCLGAAFAHRFARRDQLAAGTFGECVHPDRDQHLVRLM